MTAHWISETFQPCSAALSCTRLKGKHDYSKLASSIHSIMKTFEIPNSKVSAIVTDNASNFAKAFKEFGLHNVFVDNRNDYEVSEEFDMEVIDLELDDLDNELTFTTPVLPNSRLSYNLPPHFRCTCHTLNLIASSDLKKFIDNLDSEIKNVHSSMLEKCSYLWKASRQTHSAEKIDDVLKKNLPYPCITRWNSLFFALQFIIEHEKDIDAACNALEIEQLDMMEKQYLNDFCTALKPIAQALDKFQSEKTLYGDFLPRIFDIEITLNDLINESNDNETVKLLAQGLLTNFETRFKKFLKLETCTEVNNAILATSTHPLYKLSIFTPEEKEKVRKLMQKYAFEIAETETSLLCTTASTSATTESNREVGSQIVEKEADTASALKNRLAGRRGKSGELSTESTNKHNDISMAVNAEVDRFIEDRRETLEILHEYKYIKRLFLKCNVILSSSASVERLFSFAKLILNDRRGRLTDDMFESLLMLHGNL